MGLLERGSQPEQCFYLNFKIVNFEEAFPHLISSKLEEHGKPQVISTMASKAASLVSSCPRVAHGFADKITSALSRKLPEVFAEMGISVEVRKVFSSVQWVVLRTEVKEVDILTLLRSEKVGKAGLADRLETFVHMLSKYTCLPRLLRRGVQEKFKAKLEMMLPAKMWKKTGFKVLLVSKSSSEQAEYFFDTILPSDIRVEYKLLSHGEGLQDAINQKWKNEVGGVLGAGIAKVTGHVAKNMPPKVIAQRIGKAVISRHVLQIAQQEGMELSIVNRIFDDDGRGYINIHLHYVDTAKIGVPIEGGVYYRLSRTQRSDVVQASCERLQRELAKFFAGRKLDMELQVHKGHKATDNFEMEMGEDDGELELPPGVY